MRSSSIGMGLSMRIQIVKYIILMKEHIKYLQSLKTSSWDIKKEVEG